MRFHHASHLAVEKCHSEGERLHPYSHPELHLSEGARSPPLVPATVFHVDGLIAENYLPHQQLFDVEDNDRRRHVQRSKERK